MAKVTKHQAKDGSLHDTARQCDAHDRKLRIAPAMEKFVNGLLPTAPGMGHDDVGNPVVFLTDLPTFLAEHAESLRDAINNALVTRRPRKTAAKKAAPVATPAGTQDNQFAMAA